MCACPCSSNALRVGAVCMHCVWWPDMLIRCLCCNGRGESVRSFGVCEKGGVGEEKLRDDEGGCVGSVGGAGGVAGVADLLLR